MRTPTDAPVLTNSRQNHSVHTGVAGASVTRVSEGRTLDLPEGQKGVLEGRERGQGWGRGRHPIQGSRGWGVRRAPHGRCMAGLGAGGIPRGCVSLGGR